MAISVYTLSVLVTTLIAVPILLVYFSLLKPPSEPRGVPTIPFWITLLALWKDVDQEDLFKRYIQQPLQKHGAVKIFFASQWNILVAQPSLLAQIFKDEDDFQKSGNHKKIPGSVLASYLGENIISSHGETWRTFRTIMQPGLQENWTIDSMFRNTRLLCDQLAEKEVKDRSRGAARPVVVREILQRYTIANIANVIMGVDFDSMQREDSAISRLQTSIKQQIFRPLFMSFPFLDNMGLPSREKARQAATQFTDYIASEVTKACDDQKRQNIATQCTNQGRSGLSQSLLTAWRNGQISEQQWRNNLTIVFVAGQENPELASVSILYLLAKNPHFQEILFNEYGGVEKNECSAEELNSFPLLTSVVLESLRLLPPIGQLINRRASTSLLLGEKGMYIPEGTYLGYNSYATNRDPDAWGTDADQFRPDRWGNSTYSIQKEYRRRKARAEFISFHGGRRACLGERFALLQLKVMLFMLVRRFRWTLDPKWPDRMTPVSLKSASRAVRHLFGTVITICVGRSIEPERSSLAI